jgi:hypothetical protein
MRIKSLAVRTKLLAGIVLSGAYVGLLVGVTAALYNRLTTPGSI